MKKLISLHIISSLVLTSCLMLNVGRASAQTGAAGANVPVTQTGIVIPDGMEFTLVMTETISSKTASEGDPISLKVEEDVKIDGVVVIARGTLVKGYISDAAKSGFFGKGGKLNIRIESTQTVDKQTLKLRASKGKEGSDATGATVALVVLFGPLGFLKKGKNAEIKEGTKVKVYTDETKTVQVPQP